MNKQAWVRCRWYGQDETVIETLCPECMCRNIHVRPLIPDYDEHIRPYDTDGIQTWCEGCGDILE